MEKTYVAFFPMQPNVSTRINTKGPGKRGHIVADTNVSPFARARNICCGHTFCVRDTKNVSDFVQKHFVSATNVSQFAQPKKHHEQQCVRNNVSSFASTLNVAILMTNEEWMSTGRDKHLSSFCPGSNPNRVGS